MQRLALTALLVRDYDEALGFYVGKLGFELVEDTPQGDGKRWVVVRPKDSQGALLLARAADDRQIQAVGAQAGGRVFLFLETDDFEGDHGRMQASGVSFLEEPRREPYGVVAVFEDLYGNRWDLIQRSAGAS
jgi:catechol 2,3-dioxygenase-like lactoylglutathione lyase family enzyme